MALQLALSSARRIFELIDSRERDRGEARRRSRCPRFAEAIRYENVSFRYGDEPVLADIDLTIRAGETVAIVGPVRAPGRRRSSTCSRGCTTRPADGSRSTASTCGTRRSRRFGARSASSPRRRSSSTRTARENIAYGEPDASEETVRAAADAAFADEFVEPPAGGLRHPARRGRRAPLRRPETAAGDRPRDLQGRADPDPRRGDLPARLGVGGAGRAGARQPHAGADDARHRAPPLDGPAGRPHPRSRPRAARRVRARTPSS